MGDLLGALLLAAFALLFAVIMWRLVLAILYVCMRFGIRRAREVSLIVARARRDGVSYSGSRAARSTYFDAIRLYLIARTQMALAEINAGKANAGHIRDLLDAALFRVPEASFALSQLALRARKISDEDKSIEAAMWLAVSINFATDPRRRAKTRGLLQQVQVKLTPAARERSKNMAEGFQREADAMKADVRTVILRSVRARERTSSINS